MFHLDKETFDVDTSYGNTVQFDVLINLDGYGYITQGSGEISLDTDRDAIVFFLNSVDPPPLNDESKVRFRITDADGNVIILKCFDVKLAQYIGINWAKFTVNLSHSESNKIPATDKSYEWDFTLYANPEADDGTIPPVDMNLEPDPMSTSGATVNVPWNAEWVHTPFEEGDTAQWTVYPIRSSDRYGL